MWDKFLEPPMDADVRPKMLLKNVIPTKPANVSWATRNSLPGATLKYLKNILELICI